VFHVKHALLVLLLAAGTAWAGGEAVSFAGRGVQLTGRIYRPGAAGPNPAIVMLHGCSGLWGKDGEPTASYAFWAEHFRSRGYVALLVDSFGPRGEREICTQATRRVSEAHDRPADAYSALRWLAARADVDPARVHLMGWSNGGSTVLHAIASGAGRAEAQQPRFRSAVALYPGCASLAKADYVPVVPVLIQAGAADDWTPSRFCETLASRAPAGMVEIDVYPDAHHAFDRIGGRVRERPDVRNPNRPQGRGATVGPNPEAREKAIARVTAWIGEKDR
jgi:dienelactone hydrolase